MKSRVIILALVLGIAGLLAIVAIVANETAPNLNALPRPTLVHEMRYGKSLTVLAGQTPSGDEPLYRAFKVQITREAIPAPISSLVLGEKEILLRDLEDQLNAFEMIDDVYYFRAKNASITVIDSGVDMLLMRCSFLDPARVAMRDGPVATLRTKSGDAIGKPGTRHDVVKVLGEPTSERSELAY